MAWWVSVRGPEPNVLVDRTPEAIAASGLIALVSTLGFWAAAAFLWQTALGARGARDVATRAADRAGDRAGLIVGLKLAWLLSGLLGVLPAFLGGESDRWEHVRTDGVFAWCYASLLTGLAALWLVRRREPLRRGGEIAATAAVCGGMAVALLVAALAALASGTVAGVFPGSGLVTTFADVSDWAGDRILATQVATVVLAGVFGLILHRLRVAPPAATALLMVFALWSLPRAIDVASISRGGDGVGFLRLELITLDVTVTVAAAALLLARARGLIDVRPDVVVAAVVASTLVAHTGWALSALLSDTATFYVALVFAPVYQFALGARMLNKPRPERPARVLEATGLATGAMALVAVQEAVGFTGPGRVGIDALAALLIAMPLAAVLVASWQPSVTTVTQR
jgi:hypothetical protein